MQTANLKQLGKWQKFFVSYAPYIIFGVILIIPPPFLSTYLQSMLVKVLIFAIFALGLNVLWGYTGLISLGHAAYFGLGGYTAAFLILRCGTANFWLVTAAGILMAVLIAAAFGVIALRVSGIYFLLVTLALGELLYSAAMKWRTMTGGENGLVGVGYPDLGLPWIVMNSISFYYLVVVIFVVCFLLLYRLVNSPFGHALQGIREDERRMKYLGYNTWLCKYIAFIVGGGFAGVAGVLLVHYSGVVTPVQLGVTTSTLAMLMVVIGSDRVFFGPVLGAALVVLLEHFASIYAPERWPLILGGVFVVAVMFLRGGISIHLVKLWNKVNYRNASIED